ncbi:hypothetical protein BKA70DRAFT_1564694 [Coprinopsis sp. MPI-PUGE-AT-0042]|nr:hypothetical protein BKA70DRAFT_1564694 [Coprinopsis sp. MPI-PUGE-AT-0042]
MARTKTNMMTRTTARHGSLSPMSATREISSVGMAHICVQNRPIYGLSMDENILCAPRMHLYILSSVFRDHQRLERVIISLKDDKLHGLLNEVTNRMPNLSHLSLHNLSSNGLLLPSPLLANHAPQLRILSLDNFTPPWKSPILEGLTSLCILNTYHYHNIPPPPLKIFLDALARMPSLKAPSPLRKLCPTQTHPTHIFPPFIFPLLAT